jgi:hypothetical protein
MLYNKVLSNNNVVTYGSGNSFIERDNKSSGFYNNIQGIIKIYYLFRPTKFRFRCKQFSYRIR